MELGIDGKIALVAAASQGLGRATAARLAREGATVVICARRAGVLGEVAAAINDDCGREAALAVAGDLTDPADIRRIAETVAGHGGADILVNNAGGPPPGYFDDLDDDDWRRAYELTLMSAVRLTRAVLPEMRRKRWGRIVNLTSSSVKQPIGQLLLSNSLRLGVIGWAKSLANELAGDNVLVNNVCTGWTRTDRVTQLLESRADADGIAAADVENSIVAGIPLGRLGRAEEIADTVAFLASERASFITGVSLTVDGGAVQFPL